MYRVPTIAVALAAALPLATAANAADVVFNGSMSGPAFVAPNAVCAPIPFQGQITNALGSSNYGAFTYSHTVCTSGSAGGPVLGNFTINVGGDLLQGTLNGTASPTAVPYISNLLFTYLITSGTGQFLGATGSFTGSGTANTLNAPPSTVSLNFRAVPEPGTWALMLVGFGAIGWSMRSRRAMPAFRPA